MEAQTCICKRIYGIGIRTNSMSVGYKKKERYVGESPEYNKQYLWYYFGTKLREINYYD